MLQLVWNRPEPVVVPDALSEEVERLRFLSVLEERSGILPTLRHYDVWCASNVLTLRDRLAAAPASNGIVVHSFLARSFNEAKALFQLALQICGEDDVPVHG